MDRRILGAVLLVLGILGLAYGGFSYTRERHDTEVGPVRIEVGDREHVTIPLWAGVGLAAVGAVLLIAPQAGTKS